MAMRDDAWYPDDETRDTTSDEEEARVTAILRHVFCADPLSALHQPHAALDREAFPQAPRGPAVTFSTYRRLVERMVARDGFTVGVAHVPARFAPQLIMRFTRDGYQVYGQRTHRLPPTVRLSVHAAPPSTRDH